MGWGRTQRSVSEVRRVADPRDIFIEPRPRGHLARGLGRAYGDAALNAGGVVWDTTRLDSLQIDPSSRSARAGAGVSFAALLRACLASGLFPSVTPGTRYVTVGGAIAADVHGKNHHRDGSIRRHVRSITIMTGDGEVRRVSPGHDLFEATVGGMGLTGIILDATLDLLPVASRTMLVERARTDHLDATLEALHDADARHRYTVAWVDLAAAGSTMGRGVVDAGDHAASSPTETAPDGPGREARLTVPRGLPSGLINRTSVRIFNELWYRRTPRHRTSTMSIDSFFYPLDAVRNWNRLYGRRGFLQHQFVVPDGAEAEIAAVIEGLRSPAVAALAVLKRFGDGAGLLSFPMRGWTLSVDIPAADDPQLTEVLDQWDRRVTDVGGRVYLAKDARMRRGLLAEMYPGLDKWREIAHSYDPERRFRSDLDRRLGLRDR